ncbi:hypothetical protein [Streptomyces sp. NPDC001985]|uniref:hypothetical protein n=1 Tax=Streptomyces sp. NPDC001985 TaxID=3154406 RepID=UPI003323A529
MARHAAHRPHPPRRTALRAGLTAAALAAALATGETAHAAGSPAVDGGLDAVGAAVGGPGSGAAGAIGNSVSGLGHLTSLQLNPLANTGVDPLANSLGTQIADFKPITTEVLTGPLSQGGALKDLPLVGDVVKMLPL